jgi:hypothetical protein
MDDGKHGLLDRLMDRLTQMHTIDHIVQNTKSLHFFLQQSYMPADFPFISLSFCLYRHVITFAVLCSVRRLLVTARVVPSSLIPPKRQFLKESHGVTFQETPFIIVTAVKTSNLTTFRLLSKVYYAVA